MPGKRRSGPGVRAEVSRDPCDISRRCKDPSAGKTLVTGAAPCDDIFRGLSQPSECGALPSEGNQGDEWDA